MSAVPSEARARQTPPPNRFSLFPLFVATTAWIFGVLPIVYEPGHFFFPITILPGLLILPIAALAWLVAFVSLVVRRQRMRALSLIVALVAFVAAVPLTFHFMDEICFWTLSPYYFAKVAQLQPDSNGVRSAAFHWRGGLGWDTTLLYDEADTIAPEPGQNRVVARLYGHFYLDTVY